MPGRTVPQQRENGIDWRECPSRRVHSRGRTEVVLALPSADHEPDFTFCWFAHDGHRAADEVDREAVASERSAVNGALRSASSTSTTALQSSPSPGRESDAGNPQLRLPNSRSPETPTALVLATCHARAPSAPGGSVAFPRASTPHPAARLTSPSALLGSIRWHRAVILIGSLRASRLTGLRLRIHRPPPR